MCSFCNQHTISGAQNAPSAEEVRRICEQALAEVKEPRNAEIAFFGGSFTAIPRAYMLELLEAAAEFVGEGRFHGIRISTRPDCIDADILELLKRYGVTSIELGAQSMKNSVLTANGRGHTVQAVYDASALIKEYGFELGLQMMVGLYGSTRSHELETMDRIIKIHPDTVRIYPVVVLNGTRLAELYRAGEYRLMPFDTIAELCAQMLLKFDNAGIEVIKCGLHASDGVEGEQIAGYYHPAFRELCESLIYMRAIEKAIIERNNGIGFVQALKQHFDGVTVAVNPSCISKALGHKKSNYEYFKKLGISIKVIGDEKIPKYQCELRR